MVSLANSVNLIIQYDKGIHKKGQLLINNHMADIAISGLTQTTPLGNYRTPITTGNTTLIAVISALPVDWTSIVNKPAYGTNGYGTRFISAVAPTAGDGANGDIWYKTT